MPVTALQSAIAKALAKNRTPDSYLAGGAALHFEPQSIRYSHDLDYFNDTEKRVAEAFNLDRITLEKLNFKFEVEMNQPGYIRAVVSQNQESTKIEWAHDSAWRFLPTQYFEDRGYTLHPIDLAINKVLALVGRDEPRDYLDVHHSHQNILSLGAMTWAACGKDPGFTPWSLLEMMRRRGKYHHEDFSRLHLNAKVDLVKLKSDWLKMLDETERLIQALPTEEIGCLYYNQNTQKFVTPPIHRPKEVVTHFGRMGGVLPAFK
jgi:hypothetical protein